MGWMEGIVILSSYKHHFIIVHENLVQHPSNNISIIFRSNSSLWALCHWAIFELVAWYKPICVATHTLTESNRTLHSKLNLFLKFLKHIISYVSFQTFIKFWLVGSKQIVYILFNQFHRRGSFVYHYMGCISIYRLFVITLYIRGWYVCCVKPLEKRPDKYCIVLLF